MSFLGQLRIPWTINLSTIVPEGYHSVADISFNSALIKAVGGPYSFDPKRKLPIAVFAGGKRTDSLSDKIKEKTDINTKLTGPEKRAKEAESDFIKAVSRGYLRSKKSRNDELEEAIDELISQILPLAQELLGPVSKNRDYTLLHKIAWDGFGFSDLEWIIEATSLIDIEWKTTFVSKCNDLYNDGVLQAIENLYDPRLEDINTTHVRLEEVRNLLFTSIATAQEQVKEILDSEDIKAANDGAYPSIKVSLDYAPNLSIKFEEFSSEMGKLRLWPDGLAKSEDLDQQWESKRDEYTGHANKENVATDRKLLADELNQAETVWKNRQESIAENIIVFFKYYEGYIKMLTDLYQTIEAKRNKNADIKKDPKALSIENATKNLAIKISIGNQSLTETKVAFGKIEFSFKLLPWSDYKLTVWTRFFSQDDTYTFVELIADLTKAWPTGDEEGPETIPEVTLPAEGNP